MRRASTIPTAVLRLTMQMVCVPWESPVCYAASVPVDQMLLVESLLTVPLALPSQPMVSGTQSPSTL